MTLRCEPMASLDNLFSHISMLSTTFLVVAFSLVSFSHASILTATPSGRYQSTCRRIANAISNSSQVFYPNSIQYDADIEHAIVSSSQVSACSVEPGSAADVGVILRVLGSTRTPFAVKGGGHAFNPGFSSTSGVQISMTRFSNIELNNATGTVDVGSGVTWDQVYAALDSTGVNIVGGRIPTVGISGLTLGGGYAFMSNQYGLSIDNMERYELALPNGTITNVTESNKDLWFALRGGGNNFGIVTKFTYKTVPQGQVWGGTLNYNVDQLDLVKEAVLKFQQKNDTKAALNVPVIYTPAGAISAAVLFYNAPTPAPGIFDDFLAIPSNQSDVKTRSFADMFNSLSFINPPNTARGRVNGVSVTQYSSSVFDAFVNQTLFWGGKIAALDPNLTVAITLEPFLKDVFSHGSDSAFPPDRSHALFPTAVTFAYTNTSLDGTVSKALRSYSDAVTAVAVVDGQNVSHAAVYPNYALFDTPLEDIYGVNLPRLHAIRKAVDPKDVMGLAGGFKL
ncbi:FAD-binding domain-containing protein [Lactarius akahatsu]|uniref:FAD-binding domain-containing protein n=1 Tax=Lactarius akahatsu TaxID=416441 RepID=A0AAD4L9S8_9AGAM|nr:FAD-binding domain-containing protein [Lactarius akahatsu]